MKVKLTKVQIALEYGMRTNPSRGNGIPREGFYAIVKIVDVALTSHPKSLKVDAYYHPFEPDFSEKHLVNGQFSSIFNRDSKGPQDMLVGELDKAVIHIKSVKLVEREFEGKPIEGYVVTWELIDYLNPDLSIKQSNADSEANAELNADEEEVDDIEPEYSDDEEWAFYVANELTETVGYDENEFLLDLWEQQNAPSNDLNA